MPSDLDPSRRTLANPLGRALRATSQWRFIGLVVHAARPPCEIRRSHWVEPFEIGSDGLGRSTERQWAPPHAEIGHQHSMFPFCSNRFSENGGASDWGADHRGHLWFGQRVIIFADNHFLCHRFQNEYKCEVIRPSYGCTWRNFIALIRGEKRFQFKSNKVALEMIIFYYREKLKENVSFAKFYSLAKGVHFFREKISQWISRSALFFPVHKWDIPCVWCVVCGCANIKGSIAASSNKYGLQTSTDTRRHISAPTKAKPIPHPRRSSGFFGCGISKMLPGIALRRPFRDYCIYAINFYRYCFLVCAREKQREIFSCFSQEARNSGQLQCRRL